MRVVPGDPVGALAAGRRVDIRSVALPFAVGVSVTGLDQDVPPDVLERDVDRGRTGGLEHPERSVALGDRLATEHHPDVTLQRLDAWRTGVVPDVFGGSLRLHVRGSRGAIQRYA